MQVGEGQQVQIVQAAAQGQAQAQAAQPAGQTMQVMQQIITNTGEIQQIPVRAAPPCLPSWLCIVVSLNTLLSSLKIYICKRSGEVMLNPCVILSTAIMWMFCRELHIISVSQPLWNSLFHLILNTRFNYDVPPRFNVFMIFKHHVYMHVKHLLLILIERWCRCVQYLG